jgi:hypothetical protein
LLQNYFGQMVDVMRREEVGLDPEATRAKGEEQEQEEDAGNAKPTIRGTQQGEAGGYESGEKPDERRKLQKARRHDPQEERKDQRYERTAQPIDRRAPIGALPF